MLRIVSNEWLKDRRRWIHLAGLVALVGLVAGCGGEYPGSTIEPKTDLGETVQSLYVSVFWWTMFIGVVVWAILGYTIFRFREKPGQDKPKQIHGHLGMEIAWTIGPAIIVVAIAIPTVQAVFATQTPAEGDALVIEVTGHRYWWEFQYPAQEISTANQLHLPVGRPVTLQLTSDDVIHSFWVPMLGGKRDVNVARSRPDDLPTEYNTLNFTLNEAGEFMGQCAEFCGESHALMGIRVIAQSEEDFDAWVQDMNTPSSTAVGPPSDADAQGADAADTPTEPLLVTLGRETFMTSTCVACHAIEGTAAQGVMGPDLTRLGDRSHIGAGMLENTPENLVRWIRDPSTVKPGVRMPSTDQEAIMPTGQGTWPATGLTDDQVEAVAAYLSSLR
jgi:cytochrome c oxidase subunit 2